MNTMAAPVSQDHPLLRSDVLDIPLVSAPTPQTPYWHRHEPTIKVTHLDPGHQALKATFPIEWEVLLKVKALTDALASLDLPGALTDEEHHARSRPLLLSLAEELSGIDRIADDAARVRAFAEEGVWPTVTLSVPEDGTPWIYCGPLNTWGEHASRTPVCLLVSRPDPVLQSAVDEVDHGMDGVRSTISEALGGPVTSAMDTRPLMRVHDLLLAGGRFVDGHKNFAHFFPLEAPHATVEGAEFTMVFANIHAARIRHCSLPLLRHHVGEFAPERPEEILASSLRWFRSHDLAHFWRLEPTDGAATATPPAGGLSDFEGMVLEETYADVLGLISAWALHPSPSLSVAFHAELLRYLSRRYDHFADTAAAALTLGWLHANNTRFDTPETEWRKAVLPALAELARRIHGVLWGDDTSGTAPLRHALNSGNELSGALRELHRSVPTDIDYTFG